MAKFWPYYFFFFLIFLFFLVAVSTGVLSLQGVSVSTQHKGGGSVLSGESPVSSMGAAGGGEGGGTFSWSCCSTPPPLPLCCCSSVAATVMSTRGFRSSTARGRERRRELAPLRPSNRETPAWSKSPPTYCCTFQTMQALNLKQND